MIFMRQRDCMRRSSAGAPAARRGTHGASLAHMTTPRVATDRPATAAEVTNLLGEIDPIAVERLVATGATIDEIAQAATDLDDEVEFAESSRVASSPREAELRAILDELVFSVPEDEYPQDTTWA
jgi:hypothetical protein